jgi:hypothetical protein
MATRRARSEERLSASTPCGTCRLDVGSKPGKIRSGQKSPGEIGSEAQHD